MTTEGYTDIEIPESTVIILKLLGMVHETEQGVVELTEKGSAWLKDYCDRKIAELTGEDDDVGR